MVRASWLSHLGQDSARSSESLSWLPRSEALLLLLRNFSGGNSGGHGKKTPLLRHWLP